MGPEMSRIRSGINRTRTCSLAIAACCLWMLVTPPAVFSQDSELIEMILELIQDPDKDMRAIALDQIRTEAKTEAATKRFADQLSKLPPESQQGLLSALADRGDAAAKPAVRELLSAPEQSVRIAAMRALAKLGDASDCEKLVAFLDSAEPERRAATISLTQIQGDGVVEEIASQIDGASAAIQVSLIDVLASRRALVAIPNLLQLALADRAAVREAAMSALGQLAGPQHISGLVQGVLKADGRAERANAERSLARVCHRIEDGRSPANALVAAIDELRDQDQIKMLVSLGRVGGPAALARIEKSIGSQDPAEHSMGLSAIANWPDSSVADRLTDLAYNDPHLNHQLTALRALIRVAPLDDGRTNQEKLAMLQQAMQMSHRYVDRNYALQRASAIRIPETLRWVSPFLDDPMYAQQACKTIVELAHIRDLRDNNKAEFHAALDRVMAISEDPVVVDRAKRYKQGQTWVRTN